MFSAGTQRPSLAPQGLVPFAVRANGGPMGSVGVQMMSLNRMHAARRLALGAALGIGLATAAVAQPAREFERAELGYLNADVRAEVERRATGGNTPRGVMETIMLNNLQLRLPATEVVAVDFLKSTVVYRTPDGALRTARFNPANLTVVE